MKPISTDEGSTVVKGTEDVLRKSEAQFRLLVQSVTDYAIYMLSPEGIVANWNAGAERIKGYAPQEIIGQHFSKFYSPKDVAAGLPQIGLDTALREGRFEKEGWRYRKDGSRFWANVVIDPIRSDAGELVGFANITRDVTERRRVEAARLAAAEVSRGSEEQFRLLVQGVSDYAIYLLDPQGIVSSWNAGAERIKGYKAGEIIGSHFSQFYSEEDRKNLEPQKGLETALREGRFEKEGWRYRKDGSKFWANVVIDAIRTPDGEHVGYAKVTRDMTERKQAQELLDRAREAMAQSQKMDAIGQLTGGVAHDFNNLLMAVLGSLELIRRRLPDDPKLKLLLNNAFEGARRGVSLSQRMLSFARRQELSLSAVDVKSLVSEMSDILERSLGPLMTIETDIAEGLPRIKADANQLETALLNLTVNSRDAMPAGGTITISARLVSTPPMMGAKALNSECIALTVTDTGEGMDADTLSRSLEPFFTTKGIGKGTGLGLSMVHGITEQLGGRLRIESRKGSGTTVELWLPLADAETLPLAAVATVTVAVSVKKSRVIVIVDDDKLVLTNTKAMLEDFGHTVIEASSGAAALEAIRNTSHVDLVITDQAMPQMTGMQLAAAIKVDWPTMPILLVSGYAELPSKTSFEVPKLAKPFSLDDLEDAVARTIAGNAITDKFDSSYRH